MRRNPDDLTDGKSQGVKLETKSFNYECATGNIRAAETSVALSSLPGQLILEAEFQRSVPNSMLLSDRSQR